MLAHAIITALIFSVGTPALAWGERGHQVVSRVAVALLKDRNPNKPELWHPFVKKTEMLAHLANIPDTHWKSLPREMTEYLNPTHWFDVEYVSTNLNSVPADIDELYNLIYKQCDSSLIKKRLNCDQAKDKNQVLNMTGTAPWRAAHFTRLIAEALGDLQIKAKQKSASKELLIQRTNTALLYAGLLGHFVGDLAQPLHLSEDYDGWERGQGGLHHYFEEDVIDQLPLDLDLLVFDYAKAQDPLKKILTSAKSRLLAQKDKEPQELDIALALGYDSFSKVEYLYGLDQKSLVEKASQRDDKAKSLALRKNSSEGVKILRDLAIERLAYGAVVLSYLWESAWLKAGAPDLSAYNSYFYHLQPDPILPDYIDVPARIFQKSNAE